MSTPYFTDEKRAPTEAAILIATGPAAPAWRALFERIHAEHPDLKPTWSYYADGKSWLLKVTRKAKTVFWLSVEENAFKVTFYFAERLTGALLESELSEQRKAEIRRGAPSGKLRAVTVKLGPPRGIRDVMTLIALKSVLK